jgi:cytochrome P450
LWLIQSPQESLNFGHGPGACPGRFFAIYEIKTLLVNILMDYDIRLKEGVKPQNMVHHVTNNPDFTAVIEVRKRTV